MSLTANILRFVLSLKIVLVAFIVSALAFGYYVAAREGIHAANEARYESLLLMQELRQSSDDLTRMVRTYVATGDARYRNHFDEIIAIREGLMPRPLEYEEVYWDLVLDDRRPSAAGAASALLQRMEASGFTAEEMNRLAAAKRNSDLLANIEREAMALVGAGDIAPEQRQQALRMLFDARYHRAKADVMRPLAEASRLVRARNAEMVANAERHAFRALLLFALSGVALVFTLGWTYRNLRLVFGGSVEQLSAVATAAGDLAAPGPTVEEIGDRDSIIGKLVEAQRVRVEDEDIRKDSERAISDAERRLRSVAGALDGGVCVVQDALIRFVNDKLQQILEQPEAELVDRPFIQFVHDEDRARLMERYRRRVEGIPISAETEFRVCTRPGVLRGIVSRAKEFEWAGRPATLYFVDMIGESGAA